MAGRRRPTSNRELVRVRDLYNSVTVFGDTRAQRWLGTHGPLLFSKQGWEDHLEALLAREDDEEADMEDEAPAQ